MASPDFQGLPSMHHPERLNTAIQGSGQTHLGARFAGRGERRGRQRRWAWQHRANVRDNFRARLFSPAAVSVGLPDRRRLCSQPALSQPPVETCRNTHSLARGTDGSNPLPSSGESRPKIFGASSVKRQGQWEAVKKRLPFCAARARLAGSATADLDRREQ